VCLDLYLHPCLRDEHRDTVSSAFIKTGFSRIILDSANEIIIAHRSNLNSRFM
jgi:hypothetical protein